MTVVQVEKNAEALTMAFVAEFDAPQERVWQLWSDPRQLERWWGPPTWPATFVRHEFEVGGIASYYMTGPDGERMHGWWEITALQAPERIEFLDGFADEEGNRSTEIDPTKGVVTLEDASGRTRMSIVTSLHERRAARRDGEDGHGGGHAARARPDRRHPGGESGLIPRARLTVALQHTPVRGRPCLKCAVLPRRRRVEVRRSNGDTTGG